MANHTRFEQIAKEVVGNLIYSEIKDEEFDFGLITVTKCVISSDKSYLDVYVSSFKNGENLPKALAKHGFFIQREANKKIPTRRVPKIRFRYDDSGENSVEITKLIDNLKTD